MAEQVILTEVDISTENAVQDIIKLKDQIALLKAQTEKAKKEQGELSEEYIQYSAALKGTQSDLRTQENLLTKVSAAQQTGSMSRKQMAAEYAVITDRLSMLSAEEIKNNASAQSMISRATELKASMIEFDKSVGNTSSSVGNYEEAIKNATAGMDAFSGGSTNILTNFIQINNQEGGVKSFFGTVVSGLGSATKAGLIFILTPIGATIAAIVAGIALFTAAIKGNQAESDKFSKAMAGLSEILNVLLGYAVKAGTALIEMFSKPKELIKSLGQFLEDNLINRFKGLVKIGSAIMEIFTNPKKGLKDLGDAVLQTTTGVENLTGKLAKFGKNVADQFKQAYDAGAKLKEMQIALEVAQNAAIVTNANLAAKIEKLSQASGDNTKSLKQQNEATAALGAAQKQQAALALSLANQEMANQQAILENKKRTNGSVSREDEKAYNEALAKTIEANASLVNIENETAKRRREIKKDQLNRELDLLIDGYDSYKTYNEKIINDDRNTVAQRQAMLDDLRKRQEIVFQQEIQTIEKNYKVKIDGNALVQESDAKTLSGMVANLNLADDISGRLLETIRERRAALGDFNDTQKTLDEARANNAVELMNFELTNFQNAYTLRQGIVDKNAAFNINAEKNRVASEISYQEKVEKKKNEILKTQLDNRLITQQQYDQQIKQNEFDREIAVMDIKKSFEDSERERKLSVLKTDYDNDTALFENNVLRKLDLQREYNKTLEAEEIKSAKKIGMTEEQISKIRQKYAKADKEIERTKTDAKLSYAKGFAQNIATIAGESSKVGKAAAVAATTIDTYQSATAAYKGMVEAIPGPIGIAAGGVAAAAAVAAGLANVRKILAVDTSSTSASVSPDTSSAASTSITSTLTSANADIASGIVSRDTTLQTGKAAETPRILVVDDVTAAQNFAGQKRGTNII